ncbi:succinate-semialdehyde dehydrogenase [Favolaschia claudopus]|uniref:aldehyde dehydrogenase (NAD(+)) n=1 Tax=Favolaschia claudopus TaxID=2862362 RepID=A0AAW0CTV6_9AGAR
MPDIPVGAQIFDVVFHPNESVVYTATLTGHIKAFAYDQSSHKNTFSVRPSKRSCRALTINDDGTRLYAAGKAKAIYTVNSETGDIVETRVGAHDDPINRIKHVMPWLLATGDDNGVIKLWDPRQQEAIRTHKQHFDYITDFLWLPDKHHLLATSGDGTLSVMDVRSKKSTPFAQSEDQEDELLAATTIKAGAKVVVGTQLGILSIFNRSSGYADCVDRVPGHPSSIDALCSLPSDFIESAGSPGMENTVLTGSSDGLVRAVQVLPTRLVGVVSDHGELPIERLAVGGGTGRLQLNEEEDEDDDDTGKTGKSKTESDDEDEEDTDDDAGKRRWFVASAGHDEVLRLTDLEAFFRNPTTGEEAVEASSDASENEEAEAEDDEGEPDEKEEVEEGKEDNAGSDADTDDDDSDAPTTKKRKRKPEKDPLVVRRKKGRNEVDLADGNFFDGLRVLRNTVQRSSRFLSSRAANVLSALDIPTSGDVFGVYDGEWKGSGDLVSSLCPTTGEVLAHVKTASPEELHEALSKSREAFTQFRNVPAPRRGEILRQIREALAAKRTELGALVSLEMGKIKTEGIGEVQEFVDICDYAVGLSRMMNGRVVASERPGHSILEVPNPLGVVGVLSAFNFPVAVYGWNLALSFAAGNATVWKPSPTTPLCSIAVTTIIARVLKQNGIPGAVAALVTGDKDVGAAIAEGREVDLVSFTGSERVGRIVGRTVQSRFGKVILELGGNNAAIVMPDADLEMAIPSVFFGAIGTAGQRCTSTRRLYLHRGIADQFLDRLQKVYSTLKPGDPLDEATLLGPVHSATAVETYEKTVQHLQDTKAQILVGGARYAAADAPGGSRGNFVQPTIAVPKTADPADSLWQTETFAPILNCAVFDELDEAIRWNNAVPQGLSSSLWTRDIRNVGTWIGPNGSDTGIVNVNVGTSGAEIGAAFGGNKSGGDAWKQYVRWSACTINFSDEAPLAQGVNFSV